jgi:hypothetical protein
LKKIDFVGGFAVSDTVKHLMFIEPSKIAFALIPVA